jgi:hypothetical protein
MKWIKTFESLMGYGVGDKVYVDMKLPSFKHHIGKIIEIKDKMVLIEFGEGLRATERWCNISNIKNKIKSKK